MTHPDVEELTELLYDELDATRRAGVLKHLESCDECRGRLAAWQGVRGRLAAWEVPGGRPQSGAAAARRTSMLEPVLKWAVAAAVLLGGGFALARYTQPAPPDLEALRVELKRDLRADLSKEFSAEHARFAAEQAARHAAVERGMVEALNDVESRQAGINASLRRDIVTLAVNAQKRFDQVVVADAVRAEDRPSRP